jgi:Fic family protein
MRKRAATPTRERPLELLPRRPVLTILRVVEMLETTKPTATKSVALLESLGILRETTGRKRDRTYRYAGYLDRLRVGTELIAPGRGESR